jgi:hypothetical protein
MDSYELKALLNSPEQLYFMDELLEKYQFPEDFLIQTVEYYNSKKCLETQWNLSPYFCFRYLYDNDTDLSNNWSDYHSIFKYLLDNNYTNSAILIEYKRAMKDRKIII